MQTSMDGLANANDSLTDLDDQVGHGLVTWILAAITMELVVAILVAIAWMTARV